MPGSAIHLIPDGYVGPVVIVYGVPGGATPRAEGGNPTYEITPAGVLRLATSTPPAGTDLSFYYVKPDGSRQRLEHGGDGLTLRIFSYIDGMSARGESQGEPRRWSAYVVGIPGARDDWGSIRDAAIAVATGDPSAP